MVHMPGLLYKLFLAGLDLYYDTDYIYFGDTECITVISCLFISLYLFRIYCLFDVPMMLYLHRSKFCVSSVQVHALVYNNLISLSILGSMIM